MKVLYGIENSYEDITSHFRNWDYIFIVDNDALRAKVFGDKHFGVLKHIKIQDDDNVTVVYDPSKFIFIKKDEQSKIKNANNDSDLDIIWNHIKYNNDIDSQCKLSVLHKKTKIMFGTFNDEYVEQVLAMIYIKPESKVLELGGNIGRNSLVIASILEDDKNLVVLESSKSIAQQLMHNKTINNMSFHIETSALSKQLLMQKNWETFPYDDNRYKDGTWTIVDTIIWDTLKTKYNIKFDTLVLDCEGAIYYILMDQPDMLKNFDTIIIENDFNDIEHKNYVDTVFNDNGFKSVLNIPGGWGPCYEFFYQVWKRKMD